MNRPASQTKHHHHQPQQKIYEINEISWNRSIRNSHPYTCHLATCCVILRRFKFLIAAAYIFIKLILLANAIHFLSSCLVASAHRLSYDCVRFFRASPFFRMKINRSGNKVAAPWNVKSCHDSLMEKRCPKEWAINLLWFFNSYTLCSGSLTLGAADTTDKRLHDVANQFLMLSKLEKMKRVAVQI